MLEKVKEYFARSVYAIPVICAVLVLGGFVSAGAYYLYKNKPGLDIKQLVPTSVQPATETPTATADQNALDEISKNPPKANAGNISSQKIKTSSGNAVVVSTGGSDTNNDKINQFVNEGPTSNFAYVDETGNYPGLGQVLKSYLDSTLLHSNEISYLYEVDIVDCPSCNYGGYWTGSYLYRGNDIIKAFGYITLNVANYKSSPYFEDYMKLTFSHEYGHHYTMYHRWVDQDIPSGERFSPQYYSLRGLNNASVAPDYSLGWANCDAEIIAEDFSYFYSTYHYSGVAQAHGYPSAAIKSYIEAMSAAGTSNSMPAPASEPAGDSTSPQVNITSPGNGATVSDQINISADASDNVAVARVEFTVDGVVAATATAAPYQISWDSRQVDNGRHTIVAEAIDSSGNSDESSILILVNNQQQSDQEKPTVSITEPGSNPYAWTSGRLQIQAVAQDNTAVAKIEFYINNALVATESASEIVRFWPFNGTKSGAYELKAKAYDTAGNVGETSITINKT